MRSKRARSEYLQAYPSLLRRSARDGANVHDSSAIAVATLHAVSNLPSMPCHIARLRFGRAGFAPPPPPQRSGGIPRGAFFALKDVRAKMATGKTNLSSCKMSRLWREFENRPRAANICQRVKVSTNVRDALLFPATVPSVV